MRILQACVRYPPAPGGAETHVQALSEGLAARGHDVEVHTTDLFKEVPFTRRRDWPAEKGPVRVVRHAAFTPGDEMHYTLAPSMLPALVKRAREFDLVHVHSYGYWQTVAGAVAAGVTGTPLVFTPHFHPPWSMEGGAKRRRLRAVYDRTVSRFVLNRADRVIGVSRGELEEMARVVGYDPGKTVVIPNGIDLSRFTPPPSGDAFRRAFGLRGRLVVYAGRLAVNKGLHHLVRAVAEVPDATLAIAGEDQDQRPRLEALARDLGLEDRVLFTGHLPEELYRSALAAGDVFALPSEWEAFGIVLCEAMASERACVAARVGGTEDVVADGETGRLVPYGDPAALAAAIREVLSDPEGAREMGKRGRARVAERFTWEAVVDRVLGVYRELA